MDVKLYTNKNSCSLSFRFQDSSNKIATVTAVHPPARFGSLVIQDSLVIKFSEKDPEDTGWINGGYFCFNKKICDYLPDYETPL
jgi:glucose-1-phosphate cytidylyltransferase